MVASRDAGVGGLPGWIHRSVATARNQGRLVEVDGLRSIRYYDIGEIDQRGGTPTWFGAREELQVLLKKAHQLGYQVYADWVLNHNSGVPRPLGREPALVSQVNLRPRWLDCARRKHESVE